MADKYHQLSWQESKNGITIDCSLDIAICTGKSGLIILTVPGVDGTADGYENKYVRIASDIQRSTDAAVVRIANPFITSFHWESNVRRALDYILRNAEAICGSEDVEIRIMAHSAGAAVVAKIAWEYPEVTRLLLVNLATKLGIDGIRLGLDRLINRQVTLYCGSEDASVLECKRLAADSTNPGFQLVIVDEADHNFSGEALQHFIDAPMRYLFD